jgi:hypothetical protein
MIYGILANNLCSNPRQRLRCELFPFRGVLSKNLHRRHLDKSQLAIIAAKVRAMYGQQAKERQKRKSKSVVEKVPPQTRQKARDAAGKAIGVSGKYVDMAAEVLKSGDAKLIAAVESGEVKLPEAIRRLDREGKRRGKRHRNLGLPDPAGPPAAAPASETPSEADADADFDARLRETVVGLWRGTDMPVCALVDRVHNLADRLSGELGTSPTVEPERPIAPSTAGPPGDLKAPPKGGLGRPPFPDWLEFKDKSQ